MTTVTVYDVEAKRIEKICDEHNTTSAELIEALLDAIDNGDVDLKDYNI